MGISTSIIQGHTNQFNFHIATGTEAVAALASAERLDEYLAQVQRSRANAIARQSMTYAANRLSMSQVERLRDRIQGFISDLPYRLRALRPTIVPLMPSADGGMPHTRPSNLVCLPQSISPLPSSTFLHELWHLHQRDYYTEWTAFFEKQWKWKIYEGDMDPELEKVRRLNPDTLRDPLWIWNNEWVPVCIFNNPNTPSFEDTSTVFFNARTGYRFSKLPESMAAFFSTSLSPSAYEHPCETSAYMITGDKLDCPAYRTLVGYWL
jgi:hypothetical protein